MNTKPDDHAQHRPKPGFVWIPVVLIAVLGYFLIMEHWAHIVPWLPWLILLACPLMHVFMHRGHGGGHHGPPGDGSKEDPQ
jgi:hypothetical protein